MFYSQQYIRISIKYSRIDYYFLKEHIYLLYEHLLSNHFFVPFEDFSLFNNVPLRSNYPSSDNNNLLIPLDLSICTHNVQGFNNITKKQVWKNYCISHNLNIIVLLKLSFLVHLLHSNLQKPNFIPTFGPVLIALKQVLPL